MTYPLRIAILLCSLLISACGGDSALPAISEQQSLALNPADAELSAIYDRSCKSCHTIASTGAPLTGDVQAWAERMEKGSDVLLDNVINGFGGMPPFGLCMDCQPEQFEALINFMATAPGQ